MPARPSSRTLLKILKLNQGRLGNGKARNLLIEDFGADVSAETYEHIKNQLISTGSIRKGRGRGGSIVLIESEKKTIVPRGTKNQRKSNEKKVDDLFTSLSYTPGARVTRNRKTITLLCGEDNDKIFCGWDDSKSRYYLEYRVESDNQDCTALVQKIFNDEKDIIPDLEIHTRKSNTKLFINETIAQTNRVVRDVISSLSNVTLANGPEKFSENNQINPSRYYTEIASVIKHCVVNNLRWPMRNWRQMLGFDDVDSIIDIGYSQRGYASKKPHREHVVPVCLIKEEAIRLAEKNAPVKVIADFIQHHLWVVILDEEEANLLDTSKEKGGLDLKTQMPAGWVWGDNPIERITGFTGIKISFRKAAPLPKWKPWRGRRRDKISEISKKFFSSD